MSAYKLILNGAALASMAAVLAACGTNEAKKEVDTKPAVAISPVEVAPAKPPESRASQISIETDPSSSSLTMVERRFAEGLSKYNDGNFSESIKIFKEPMFEKAWPELRMHSLKYLAFSYCVSGNSIQCKKTFVELLKVEPGFDLNSAERGHPLWGPVFQEAKNESVKLGK